MPRGGPRPGSGRPKGGGKPRGIVVPRPVAVSKDAVMAMTREIASKRALDYIDKAYAGLVDVVERGQSEAARVAAATALLDRALGKPREAPPEPASDAMKDITPPGLNGSGHKPPIDLEDWKMVGT